MWCFDRHAPPTALQVARRSTLKQVGGKADPPDEVQLGQLILHAGKAGATRTTAQLQQYRWRPACRIVLRVIITTTLFVRVKQGTEPLTCLWRQTFINICVETIFMGA